MTEFERYLGSLTITYQLEQKDIETLNRLFADEYKRGHKNGYDEAMEDDFDDDYYDDLDQEEEEDDDDDDLDDDDFFDNDMDID